jgi:chemotaxis protein CheZ
MEIAALHNTGEGEDDRFVTAAMELDAIVNATEVATNNILGSAEDIDDLAREIKERSSDVKIQDHADSIANAVINIFENCNFQDITGQRTGKVVKTINYLEERILTMINIWGEEEFEGLAAPEDNRTDDEKLLAGPQLEGKGISQNDIDSLFD